MNEMFSPHEDASETDMFLLSFCKGLDKTKDMHT